MGRGKTSHWPSWMAMDDTGTPAWNHQTLGSRTTDYCQVWPRARSPWNFVAVRSTQCTRQPAGQLVSDTGPFPSHSLSLEVRWCSHEQGGYLLSGTP